MSSSVATSASTTNSATSLSTGSNVNLSVQPQQQQLQQPPSQMHITNLILPATNAIRKRKVKFTVQLGIQELLSVPYLNGVLFCKVRLCNGGNHVSYSSKKEISNSSVIWANDLAIQFDVKVVQLYSVTNLNSMPSSATSITPSGGSQMPATTQQIYVIGYEPCLCRISVRKELRGGKSYQKLGYVDYNLSDFILKYQQDSTAAMSSTDNIEYCVNRILKEYDTQQAKKNQQRLDNSFLKIKIRINESSVVVKSTPTPVNSSIGLKMNKNDQIDGGVVDSDLKRSEKVSSTSMSTSASSSISSSLNNVNIDPSNDPKKNKAIKSSGNELIAALSPVPLSSSSASHMRNMSSVSNSGLSASFNSNTSPNPSNPLPHLINTYGPGHNRSCSNGSIKSNVSFDFMIKNKNKFLEDAPTTSTSSLATNSGRMMNNHQSIDSGTLRPSNSNNTPSIPVSAAAQMINTSYSNLIQNSKPESANTRIIESRLDANEIINAIELELSNQIQQSGGKY